MRNQLIHFSTPAKGNAILEYTGIGVLLIAGSIVAITALGSDFNVQLGGLSTEAEKRTDTAELVAARVRAAEAMATVSNGPGSKLALTGNGNNLSGSGLVQTTGASGTTHNASNQGQTQTGSKDDNDDQTPEAEKHLKKLIAELSNEAHKVAYLQKLLESVSNYSKGDVPKLQSTQIYYDGQTVNAFQLSHALSNGGAIILLEKKKNAVLASDEASNKLKKSIVKLTDKIKESAQDTSEQAQDGSGYISTRSDETHQDAKEICDKGGGFDIGSKCSPFFSFRNYDDDDDDRRGRGRD